MTEDFPTFEAFPKLARLSRKIYVTEKIDGTNAQVFVDENGRVFAGSRNRWITPENDNYGFAKWVAANAAQLSELGEGRHFGEWWGSGIQRRYAMSEKRFSLFNFGRWEQERPACCDVVPCLYQGPFSQAAIDACIDQLRESGSVAAQGFMDPEGVVIYHSASKTSMKKTVKNDETPKSAQVAA